MIKVKEMSTYLYGLVVPIIELTVETLSVCCVGTRLYTIFKF